MKPELSSGSAQAADGNATVSLNLPAEVLAAVDAYAADAAGKPDRSAVLARIVRDWLVTNGYLRSDPLDDPESGAGAA